MSDADFTWQLEFTRSPPVLFTATPLGSLRRGVLEAQVDKITSEFGMSE